MKSKYLVAQLGLKRGSIRTTLQAPVRSLPNPGSELSAVCKIIALGLIERAVSISILRPVWGGIYNLAIKNSPGLQLGISQAALQAGRVLRAPTRNVSGSSEVRPSRTQLSPPGQPPTAAARAGLREGPSPRASLSVLRALTPHQPFAFPFAPVFNERGPRALTPKPGGCRALSCPPARLRLRSCQRALRVEP